MAATVATVAYLGLEARAVEVQVQLSSGVPKFTIVGLPDKAVAESRERVRAALASIGLALPPKVITVNLSPADLPKEGSHYDLPIALCLLAAIGATDAEALSHYVAVGELSLDGRIAASPGVLLAAIHASAQDKGLICPAAQGSEASWAGELDVIAAPDLLALLAHLKGTSLVPPPIAVEAEPPGGGPDLAQVKGQEVAKRALEIAAAGGHNLLMSGPPGAGKSLLAACLPGILPPLQPSEALEVSMVASVAGELNGGRIRRRRPFRAPHHSASMPALVGGGLRVRPGEISLAHLGVLFLDELPEFQRPVLDSLRQPLETGAVSVARANTHGTFPARVQLVAALNPCRCGHLGDPALACSRAPRCAADYQARVSGPLLDRIDVVVLVPRPRAADLAAPPGEPSEAVLGRVLPARARLRERVPRRTPEADGLLTQAVERLPLSGRGRARVARVAATVAALGGAEQVEPEHVAEALSYRTPAELAA
jgi:magnesium chelatase family protein